MGFSDGCKVVYKILLIFLFKGMYRKSFLWTVQVYFLESLGELFVLGFNFLKLFRGSVFRRRDFRGQSLGARFFRNRFVENVYVCFFQEFQVIQWGLMLRRSLKVRQNLFCQFFDYYFFFLGVVIRYLYFQLYRQCLRVFCVFRN